MILEKDGFTFMNDDECLCIQASRQNECLEYLKKNKCKKVHFFPAYNNTDINFLEDFPWLEIISSDSDYIKDVSVLNKMPNLKTSWVNELNTEFTNPNISEYLGFTWTKKSGISASCKNLKHLAIWKCKETERLWSQVCELPALEELSLIQSPIATLDYIKPMKALKSLEIAYAPKLSDIREIERLKSSLTSLCFVSCKKLEDITGVESLTELKELVFSKCGTIESLKFVSKLPKLEKLVFSGTKVIDTDLSPCERIPFFDIVKRST
jgi:Leucine-rich repeat (LRR) protein